MVLNALYVTFPNIYVSSLSSTQSVHLSICLYSCQCYSYDNGLVIHLNICQSKVSPFYPYLSKVLKDAYGPWGECANWADNVIREGEAGPSESITLFLKCLISSQTKAIIIMNFILFLKRAKSN